MNKPANFPTVEAPRPCHRVVPSRFPPVNAFETVASAADIAAVMELEGWTNDRLVEHRLRRLPENQWVGGRPNASVVMAAFLHGSPNGSRFASPHLGAWYAAATAKTALVEVASAVRREVVLSALSELTADYRGYLAELGGTYVDIRGAAPDLHDPNSHSAGQVFGESVRSSDLAGISYDSVRDTGGWNIVCYRPQLVLDVRQGQHWRIRVGATGKVFVETLAEA